jgi:hypothetical protein
LLLRFDLDCYQSLDFVPLGVLGFHRVDVFNTRMTS